MYTAAKQLGVGRVPPFDSWNLPAAIQLRSQQANPKGLSGLAGLRD